MDALKSTVFFSAEKFIGHSIIQNPEKREQKKYNCFILPGQFIHYSLNISEVSIILYKSGLYFFLNFGLFSVFFLEKIIYVIRSVDLRVVFFSSLEKK